MRLYYLQKLLKYLNANYEHYADGKNVVWFLKDKTIAIWDNGDLEVVWEIFKEGVLKP